MNFIDATGTCRTVRYLQETRDVWVPTYHVHIDGENEMVVRRTRPSTWNVGAQWTASTGIADEHGDR